MKTLREYIDILDEISRRDALKYAGASALGGAIGYHQGKKPAVNENAIYRTGFLLGFLLAVEQIYDQQLARNEAGYLAPTFFSQAKKDYIELTKKLPEDYLEGDLGKVWQDGYLKGIARYHTMYPLYPRAQDEVRKFVLDYNNIYDQARAAIYGGAGQLEESEPEDPISKIDRLFR